MLTPALATAELPAAGSAFQIACSNSFRGCLNWLRSGDWGGQCIKLNSLSCSWNHYWGQGIILPNALDALPPQSTAPAGQTFSGITLSSRGSVQARKTQPTPAPRQHRPRMVTCKVMEPWTCAFLHTQAHPSTFNCKPPSSWHFPRLPASNISTIYPTATSLSFTYWKK